MSLLPHASGCAQHPLRDTDLVVSSCAQQDDIKGARRRYDILSEGSCWMVFFSSNPATHA